MTKVINEETGYIGDLYVTEDSTIVVVQGKSGEVTLIEEFEPGPPGNGWVPLDEEPNVN